MDPEQKKHAFYGSDLFANRVLKEGTKPEAIALARDYLSLRKERQEMQEKLLALYRRLETLISFFT